MKTGRYSLKELLTHNEIEQIVIPEIQRDYVWGESNVNKLLDDILKSYDKKENHQLAITVNGKTEDNASVIEFLKLEYERLKYNLKLGFIYAYHDRDYAGKFFLIDGQQRITTLFLILLYLYRTTGKVKDFKFNYFTEGIPKVDYKVREQSHDFLKLMIDSELKNEDYKKSAYFYGSEYLKDTTIIHLIENYELIVKRLEARKDKAGLLDFLENFIEFNYFDTHLSEQGEQLYIYMNSRGEQLSYQEIIRAELMQKVSDSKEKVILGKQWENWQNFFWKYRGKNENADKGFEEFLKWAMVIYLAVDENVDLENFADANKQFTRKELKENYIKDSYKDKQLRNQKEAIFKFQIKHLDFKFLKKLFDVLEWTYSNKTKYIPIQDNWLSNTIGVLDYVVLLPILYYQIVNEWVDEDIRKKEVERLAMFLKNTIYFEAISKNPDTATLDALSLVKTLVSNSKDITTLLAKKNITTTILTEAEKYKIELYQNQPEIRENWERLIWDISRDKGYSRFLLGDITVLWNVLEKEKSANSGILETDMFNEYNVLLKKIVYLNRSNDSFRLLLLAKFDYLINCGTGQGLEKYSFIGNGNAWDVLREWKAIFVKDEFVDLLLWIKEKGTEDIEELIKMAIVEFNPEPWRETFIVNPPLLHYCRNKKILWEKEYRIILLEKTNYSKVISREIQCALLQNAFKDKKMWVFENNCCVLDFELNGEDLEFKDRFKGYFAIDIKYKADIKQWSFTFFNRAKNISEILDLSGLSNWDLIDNKLISINTLGYNPDKSLIENNYDICLRLNDIIEEVKNLLKTRAHE